MYAPHGSTRSAHRSYRQPPSSTAATALSLTPLLAFLVAAAPAVALGAALGVGLSHLVHTRALGTGTARSRDGHAGTA